MSVRNLEGLLQPRSIAVIGASVRAGSVGTERLAIRPYPRELEEEVVLSDGSRVRVRPIRPEDEQ